MTTPAVDLRFGLSEGDRTSAARLMEDAFSRKLGFGSPKEGGRLAVLARALDPSAVVGAYERDRLVGLLGYRWGDTSAFVPLTFGLLWKELGVGAVRAAIVLKLLFSSKPSDRVHIEFIAVDAALRGRGVGSQLLGAIEEFGRQVGAGGLELEVVDTNPGAHQLYLQHGFVDAGTERIPLRERWMGFRESTIMVKPLECAAVVSVDRIP